jgi:Fe-Mn family superoxide dismutase
VGDFVLDPLPFGYGEMAPLIDEETMRIHHSKHHQAYVNNLNSAVVGTKYERAGLETILCNLNSTDAAKIRNNAGGHWNHRFFWSILRKPTDGLSQPSGTLLQHLDRDFGSFEKFKVDFAGAALGLFGSGWVWLIQRASDRKLVITTTPNQDNPLMRNLTKEVGTPIIGLDLWEHAYYLKHKNDRKAYVTESHSFINWERAKKLAGFT